MGSVIQVFEEVKADFYQEIITTSEWQLVDIDFVSENQTIINKEENAIEFSYDGRQIHGVLDDGEHITFDNRMRRQIWFRSPTGGGRVRFLAWRNP